MRSQKKPLFFYTVKKYVLIVFMLCLSPSLAFASFTISVTPFEGGSTLRFGRVDGTTLMNKEARVRISTTEGKQYQVFQRIVEPFVNEQGTMLQFDAFTSYALRGSNAFGTLYQEDPLVLGYVDRLLYTSNPNGDSDSFRVNYTIDGSQVNATGLFYGKILYTVTPIGGGTQQTFILDVQIETSGRFDLSVKPQHAGNAIRLDPQNPSKEQGLVTVAFKNNFSRDLNIYQELIQYPENETGDPLSRGALMFSTDQGLGEHYYKVPVALERKRVLIYSSNKNEDAILINYVLDEDTIRDEPAGIYRGLVTYVVEGFGIEETVQLDIEVVIEPVFKMGVEYPSGGLSFVGIMPGDKALIREATVKVDTNLGKPYIVTHDMSAPLTNERGTRIKNELFTIRTERMRGDGSLKFTESASVPVGEVPLYYSDAKGTPAEFKVYYRLKPDMTIMPGDYSAMIDYSLGER